MSVLDIVLLAVAGEFALGVAVGKFLRGPRPEPVPVRALSRSQLLNAEKSPELVQHRRPDSHAA